MHLPIRHYTYNNFQELELSYRHAQQEYRDQNLIKKIILINPIY